MNGFDLENHFSPLLRERSALYLLFPRKVVQPGHRITKKEYVQSSICCR